MKTKRIVTGVLAGAFLAAISAVSVPAAAETENSIMLGDPTGDGIINAVDASNILGLYSELSIEMTELTNELGAICDVNRDGCVDAVDASMVLSYYASQSSEEEEKSLEQFIVDLWEEMTADLSDYTFDWQWKDYSPEEIQNIWNNNLDWLYPDSSWDDIIDPETGEVVGLWWMNDLFGENNPWSSWDPWSVIDPETGEFNASAEIWNPWLTVTDPETGEVTAYHNPWISVEDWLKDLLPDDTEQIASENE